MLESLLMPDDCFFVLVKNVLNLTGLIKLNEFLDQ